jgi:dTDP-4-dehydrorhamnose reductase
LRILVLGSNGQLGNCLRDAAQKSKIEISFFAREDFNFLAADETNDKIDFINPNYIINAAAFTSVDAAEEDCFSANLVNNLGVEFLAKKCKKLNAHLIHISTDYIFDGLSNTPYTELSSPNPINVYGQTKYDGELAIQASNCNYTILRSSWIFSEYGANFLKTILKLAQSKESLSIINDQVGSPTYAHDIAGIIMEIVSSNTFSESNKGIYNISGSDQMSWFEFSKKIVFTAKKLGFDIVAELAPVSSINYPQKAKRPYFSALDNTKSCSKFDYRLTPINDAIFKTLQLLDQNQ